MYPEHEKLHLVVADSQKLGEFLDWLGHEGLTICTFDPQREEAPWLPLYRPLSQLLADYFGIDLAILEAEKRAMLDAQRALNARLAASRREEAPR